MTSAYSINLNPNITTPVKTGYTFKSGDKGITFNIAVTEMDPTGTSAKIAFHRANGTSVEAALSGQGPTYSYTILGNEFAVPGVVVADVKFYQSTTQRVSTASFVFNVINDTLDGLGGGTAGYSDELETLRAEMEEAAEVLDDYIDAYGELKPLNPRGDYNASTTYHPCDLVTYNNVNWICQAECTGQAPATGSAYWMRSTDAAASKADKVTGATAGNFAGLDASGNLTDSGESPASLAAIENVYSAKNLLPNNATTQTINGGTFTVNADKSVTVNGTFTSDTFLELGSAISFPMVTILTGCPTGGSAQTFLMGFRGSPWDTGSGVTVDPNVSRIPAIFIKSGYTANNLTFKPMIRDARVKDATYVPYAMTNRDITENLNNATYTAMSSTYGTVVGGYVKHGKMVVVNVRITLSSSISTGSTVLFTGMPAAAASANNVAFCTNNKDTTAILNSTSLQIDSSTGFSSGAVLIISGTYTCK